MIIVYGGSFNPVTLAHETIIKEISKLDYIDKILITPVGDKYNKSGLIDSKYRVKMLELVIKDIDKTYIDFTEILADKVLTTYETLQILQNKYPHKEIYFLLGADNLLEFSTWDNSEDILKNFGLFVVKRDGFNIESIIKEDNILLKNKSNIIIENIKIPLNVSSSNIRNYFSNSKKIDLATHLNTDVLNYINSNNLYSSSK